MAHPHGANDSGSDVHTLLHRVRRDMDEIERMIIEHSVYIVARRRLVIMQKQFPAHFCIRPIRRKRVSLIGSIVKGVVFLPVYIQRETLQ